MKHAVLNASPVIVLARAGYLDLIPKLVSSPVIPRAVVNEIQAGRSDDPAVEFLSSANWLGIVDLTPPLSPLAAWRLGQGESEVLEYAQRSPGTIAVLDDNAARRLAVALNVPIVGTLGCSSQPVKAGCCRHFKSQSTASRVVVSLLTMRLLGESFQWANNGRSWMEEVAWIGCLGFCDCRNSKRARRPQGSLEWLLI